MFEILANKMSHNDDYLPHVCHQCFERYDTEKELEKHKLRYHKTPIVPPDQGATTMTATVVPKELESEWLQFLKRRKEEAAEDKKEAPPAKKAVIKKAEETPKHSEAQSATEIPCSSQSEMASPDQGRTDEALTSLLMEEVAMEKQLKIKRKYIMEHANNILELLDRWHRPDFDEEETDEDLWNWVMDFVIVFLDYVKVLKKRKKNQI